MAIADASLTELRYALEATSEVNVITSAGATAGNFTLTIFGRLTANIVFNATAAAVQSAIDAVFGAGVVACTGGGTGANLGTSGHTVTLSWGAGRMQGYNIDITIQTGGLTGSVHTFATTTAGGAEITGGYGTAATSIGYRALRFVSETLGQDKEVVQSDEVVSDRRPPDNIQVNSGASGEIVSELTGGNTLNTITATWDDFWSASVGVDPATFPFTGDGHFTTLTTGSGAGAIVTPANDGGGTGNDRITFTLSGGSANWNASLAAGQWVYAHGFTGVRAVLNGVYQLTARTGTVLTLTRGARVPATPGAETPTTTNPFTVQRIPVVTDGTALRTFTIERAYTSLASEFARLPGMALNGFTVEMRPKAPMRVTWRWLGKEETQQTSTGASAVAAAQTTRKSFSPVSDFKFMSLDEDGHTFGLNGFKLDVKGGLYPQDEEAGTLGPQGIGLGTFEVTGSLEFYYEGGSIHTFLNAFTQKALSLSVVNSAGDAWVAVLPRVNFTGGRRSVAGKDQAIKATVDFRAAKGTDAHAGTTFLIGIGRH